MRSISTALLFPMSNKRPILGKSEVKSKYFSIESYFKTTTTNNNAEETNKRPKTSNDQLDQELEEAIKLSITESRELQIETATTIELKDTQVSQQCPICQVMIQTEFMSLEVHVNQCLDVQQSVEQEVSSLLEEQEKEEEFQQSAEQGVSSLLEQQEEEEEFFMDDNEVIDEVLSFEQKNLEQTSLKERFSFTTNDTSNVEESKPSTSPSSWKDTFSLPDSHSTQLPTTNIDNNNKKKKQRPCPFYKRVRGKTYSFLNEMMH